MKKRTIVLASNNQGKVEEINSLLAETRFNVVTQSEFDVPEAKETGLSFVENAILKARNAALYTCFPVIADDSGLEVPSLQGRPGIYSARYAGNNASDADNLDKLIEEIKPLEVTERKARFVCVMVYLRHAKDPMPIIAEGVWNGIVVPEVSGENGFGYDPVFYVPSHGCMSAELEPEVKNSLSHRAQALKLLVGKLGELE